jgi:hypothetical protein
MERHPWYCQFLVGRAGKGNHNRQRVHYRSKAGPSRSSERSGTGLLDNIEQTLGKDATLVVDNRTSIGNTVLPLSGGHHADTLITS